MQDLFNDPNFDSFLEGGVHDLDPHIGSLVHELYESKAAETFWSCSGHIDKAVEGAHSSRPETHLVYTPGVLFFRAGNFVRHHAFLDILKNYVTKTPFAELQDKGFIPLDKLPDKGLNGKKREYHLVLEMKDLSDNVFSQNAADRLGLVYNPSREVEIASAQKRYSEFVDFWKNLEESIKQSFNY